MEDRIREIFSRMTPEEKVSLTSGMDFRHSKAMEKYEIPSIAMSDGNSPGFGH